MKSHLRAARPRVLIAVPVSLLAVAAASFGQAVFAAEPAPVAASAPKESVTEELIRLLQKQNALAPEDANRLIERLRSEQAVSAPVPTPEPAGRIRVPYIPESEKAKIREEIKEGVLETARNENWAQPSALPAWLKRVTIGGDIRVRGQADLLDANNDPFAVNFQAINSGSPFNVGQPLANQVSPPLTNTTEDRQAFRVRARLDLSAKVNDDLATVFRFTTGNITNPVSTNQTLGNDFNKLSFVIDRAYVAYKPKAETLSGLEVWAGRLPNPYRSTELMFDEDLNLDGIAARYGRKPGFFRPFVTIGGYSVQNTAFDFPSTDSVKAASRDRFLLAAQLGADWSLQPDMTLSGAVAYYDFANLEGESSSPCLAPTTAFACDSDDSRPAFIQKGNTLYGIRNVLLQDATDPQFQYFGLASEFRVLNANVRYDWALTPQIHLNLDADYVRNLGYDASEVRARSPVNNFQPGVDTDGDGVEDQAGAYKGGSSGWLVQTRIGYPKIRERGDWSLSGSYRRLESDAVVDAYTDSDFHLGGTNAKGFVFGGSVGVLPNAWLTVRYFSATEISGPPLSIDVLQLDFNARF